MTSLVLAALLVVAAPAVQQKHVKQDTSGVALDFQDTDIRIVITALAEAGGLNVVFSSLPSRPVTLRTSQPIPRSGIQALLKNIVENHGMTLVEEAGVLRISAAAERQITPARPPTAPDPSPAQDSARIYVYKVKHGQAPRLAASVQALFGVAVTGFQAGLSRNSLSQQLRDQRIPPGLPQSNPAAVQSGPGRGADQRSLDVSIVADELANSLVIRARPSDYRVLEEALTALDTRPLQVLLEAMIVEVRSTDLFDLGLALRVPEQIDARTGARIAGQLGGVSAGDLVLRVMDLGGISADVIVSAISSKAKVNVVSRPVILAANNLEARILIGSQRPFIQVSRALPTDEAVRDQIVQYRDVGTSLTILPTINEDGYVSMNILQEVSNATAETQFGAPVISTREASTNLLVRDGQTAVIGGLIDQQHDQTRTGIPLLKNLPLLGGLFGSTRKSTVKTEMFLFITPHVIRTDGDAAKYRDQIQNATDLVRRLNAPRTVVPDTLSRKK